MSEELAKTGLDRPLGPVMVGSPVYDECLDVVAYKILYKDPDEFKRSLLRDADPPFLDLLGEHTSVYDGSKITSLPAYIRLPLEVASELCRSANGDEIVIEVNCGQREVEEFLPVVKNLLDQGFKVSLANYLGRNYEELLPLIASLTSVQVDVQGLKVEEIRSPILRVRNDDKLMVLAENVTTTKLFDDCVGI